MRKLKKVPLRKRSIRKSTKRSSPRKSAARLKRDALIAANVVISKKSKHKIKHLKLKNLKKPTARAARIAGLKKTHNAVVSNAYMLGLDAARYKKLIKKQKNVAKNGINKSLSRGVLKGGKNRFYSIAWEGRTKSGKVIHSHIDGVNELTTKKLKEKIKALISDDVADKGFRVRFRAKSSNRRVKGKQFLVSFKYVIKDIS